MFFERGTNTVRLFWVCLTVAIALHVGVYGVLSRAFAPGNVVEAAVQSPVFQLQLAPLQAKAPIEPVQAKPEPAPVMRQPKPVAKPAPSVRPAIPLPQVAKAPAAPKPEFKPPVMQHKSFASDAPAVAANESLAIKTAAPAAPIRPVQREVVTRDPSFKEPPAAPKYPPLARRRSQEGTVWLSIRLDEFGRQKERRVLRSSGISSLDDAALEAVAGWKFQPEVQDGQSISSRVEIPIHFALTASR